MVNCVPLNECHAEARLWPVIVQQLYCSPWVEGLLRVTRKFAKFDSNTNEKPSSTRNIPTLTGTAQLPAEYYKSASKTLIWQASNDTAIQLVGLIDVRLDNMAATNMTSGCMHSSVQSRPVRCGAHITHRSRHTSRSSVCDGKTRPNTKKFMQGWHRKSFCNCSFVKLAPVLTVEL